MINRILMELYDDYEKSNIDSLIEFTKKTLPSDGTDKLFIGCVLILFSRSSSRYYATREELLSIVKAVKEKIGDSNYLAFYVDRVNREKGISKYLKDVVMIQNMFPKCLLCRISVWRTAYGKLYAADFGRECRKSEKETSHRYRWI